MPKSRDKGKGGKGTGKGKIKGVCKGSSAGVGGAYAAPGRPKIFRMKIARKPVTSLSTSSQL